MPRSTLMFTCVVAVLGLSAIWGFADSPKANPDPKAFVGSWRQTSSKLGNQEKKAVEGQPSKIINLTPTHFTRIVFEPKTRKVLGIVGGRYTLLGQSYTETIEYADESTRKMGMPDAEFQMTFVVKVEGDRLELSMSAGGQAYLEVWERVK